MSSFIYFLLILSHSPPRPSAIRKLHDSVADPKYDGVHTARNRIFDDDEDEELDAEISDADFYSGNESSLAKVNEASDTGSGHESLKDAQEDTEDDEGAGSDSLPYRKVTFAQEASPHPPTPESKDLALSLKESRNVDRLKGKAISRQLVHIFFCHQTFFRVLT